MKIATWNVNGIRARQAQLEAWMAGERPEVLCLQEIKAAPEQIPQSLQEIPGYFSYWHGGHPEDAEFFTWWAPWRNLRQRNIGWRIDYILASTALAEKARACQSLREVGTSDHAPLVATFD
jgi:exonuclease III